MIIAIIGGRDYKDYSRMQSEIFKIISLEEIKMVVSGGAKGADSLGAAFAFDHEIEFKAFLPDWERLGRGAGLIRNEIIIKTADMIFAFWDGKSSGTKNAINHAKRLNKKLHIILY